MLTLAAIGLFAQLQIPAPVGYVNDFARIVDRASSDAMVRLIDEVRTKSGGEIVVVTIADLHGRAPIDVARDIGRQWRVGARGEPGDRARNAGVILLLKPGRRPGDGQAEIAIASGSGAEGFITDALAGRVRDEIGRRAVQDGSYAAGLVAGVARLAEAYAREFGFTLDGAPAARVAPRRAPQRAPSSAPGIVIVFFVFVLIAVVIGAASRSRRGGRYRNRPSGIPGLGWLILSQILSSHHHGRHRRGGGGSWGGGSFGGGGGGGFGGFGGGGGFSGGGASGRF